MRQLKIVQKTTNRTDNINRLFDDIRKYEILSREEEEELTYMYVKTKDPKIREKLLYSNMRFVISVAKQYEGNNTSLIDLIDEGSIGMLKAIDKFDPTRGFKLISFAVWWIRQSIQEFISTKSQNIKIPLNISAGKKKVNDFIQSYYSKHMTEPSFNDILDATEYDVKTLKNILNAIQSFTLSYDDKFNEEENDTYLSLLESKENAYQDIDNNDIKIEINQLINTLDNRSKFVIEAYFGLNNISREHSLAEIGEQLGLSRERIRQVLDKAIRKLRYSKKIINKNE